MASLVLHKLSAYLGTRSHGRNGFSRRNGLIPSAIMLVIGTRNVNHLIQKVGEKKTIYIGFSIMVLGQFSYLACLNMPQL